MAAKIIGDFKIDENSFPFTAIAFGRIGGQNIGAKLSNETENKIKELGYDLDGANYEDTSEGLANMTADVASKIADEIILTLSLAK